VSLGNAAEDHAALIAEREGRARRSRVPSLPDPSRDVVLRPHGPGALTIELMAGLVGGFVMVDGVRHGSIGATVVGLAWAVISIGVGLLLFRRSTRFDADGVRIRRLLSTQVLSWPTVSGFTLLPHRRGRRDRVAAVTPDGEVLLEHADSKSLVQRPELSRQWYLTLIDRLESVRRRYVT
jgi:hypothetical protein